MKKNFFIAVFLLLTLCGCSNDIKIQTTSDLNSERNGQIIDNNEKIPDPAQDTKMGERFLAKNLIIDGGSGEIYMSVDSAKVYNTLSDAGLSENDLFESSLLDGMNYDAQTGEFLNNRILLLVNFTVENIDATSREHAVEPEKYDKYDFRVDSFGGCTEGPVIYSDKHGEVSAHYCGFHLEPGESTQIICGYLVDLRNVLLNDVKFNTAATPENGAIIDLNLGDE